MIRIQITSPFRYKYYNGEGKLDKDVHLTAGNYYHLHPKKDILELKFILSPNFAFKNYIYVNLETVPKELLQELKLESGFYDDIQLPKNEEYIPTLLVDNKVIRDPADYLPTAAELESQEEHPDFKIVGEPAPNPFDLTTKVEEEVKEEVKEEEVINTPTLVTEEEPSQDVEDVETSDLTREGRKKELESLAASKVKEIAELYNLEYTSKKKVIPQILDLEFGNPDQVFETNIPVPQVESGSPTNIG